MRILVTVNMIGLVLSAAIAGMEVANGNFVSAHLYFAIALFCQWTASRRLSRADSFVVAALVSATILASYSVTIGHTTLGSLCAVFVLILGFMALCEQLRSV